MLIQEFPGEQEILHSRPFMGYAGQELNRMLVEAGISPSECFTTCFIQDQIVGNDPTALVEHRKNRIPADFVPYLDRHVSPAFLIYVDRIKAEIELVRPDKIVIFGNIAMWALTGKWGIKQWRGSTLVNAIGLNYDPQLLPVYPPQYILAMWKDRSVAIMDLRRVKSPDGAGDVRPWRFILRPGIETATATLSALIARCDAAPTVIACDVETRQGFMDCIGFAWSELDAICIPFTDFAIQKPYWTEPEEVEVSWLIYKLLSHPNARVIGQNFIYDAQYIYRHLHFLPRFARDTMVAHHSMWSSLLKGLDFLSSMYCKDHTYWKKQTHLTIDEHWAYNCTDACITFEVDVAEQSAIDKFVAAGWTKLREVHDFQQALFWPVIESMIKGVRIDLAARQRLAAELFSEIQDREAWLQAVVGRPININSPLQMKEFFYTELAQRPNYAKKANDDGVRPLTCDDAALTKIGEREPLLLPLLKVIAERRSLGVFLNTFVNAPLDLDQRMRCSFSVTGTSTYRFASSENAFGSGTNLQNLPKGDEDSGDPTTLRLPNVRKLFIPDRGKSFFDIDLDSADLRVVVWESDATEMKQMFAEGLKPYVEVAKEYHRDPTITKHHPSYRIFKALCHGTNYLGTPPGLAARIGLLVHEVERIQKWYYGKFPQIADWQTRLKDQVLTHKFVENVFGYRMYFHDRIQGNVFNAAVASIPQSTVGCLINRGYANIHANLPEVDVLLQVHDSLGGQFDTHLGDWALRRIVEECSVPLPYEEPLVIPVGIKASPKSWGDCG